MGKYIHAFWHIKGTKYKILEKIWKEFGDFKIAWEKSSMKDLLKAGLDQGYAEELISLRERLDLGLMMDKLWREDIHLIAHGDKEYPEELKEIFSPPFLIYRKGADLQELSNRLAIVGMRKSSAQGEKLAFGLAKACADSSITVVSGLAFGIDAAAHSGALQSTGKTIGVLASGISKITPGSHNSLASKMLEKGGAIISEYPVTFPALKNQFIERNRLISGLSHTVVVIEAAIKSGALITARHALDQNKEVLAFPGDPGKIQSAGCNWLVKNGRAGLVDAISDVLQNLHDRDKIQERKKAAPAESLDITDEKILNCLRESSRSIDEIQKEIGLDWEELMSSFSKLEIAGLIAKNSQLKWQLLPD